MTPRPPQIQSDQQVSMTDKVFIGLVPTTDAHKQQLKTFLMKKVGLPEARAAALAKL